MKWEQNGIWNGDGLKLVVVKTVSVLPVRRIFKVYRLDESLQNHILLSAKQDSQITAIGRTAIKNVCLYNFPFMQKQSNLLYLLQGRKGNESKVSKGNGMDEEDTGWRWWKCESYLHCSGLA